MFQENERMEYFSQKAPTELKNRVWSSVQQEKRKTTRRRIQGLAIAACFIGVFVVSHVMLLNSTILRINDIPVSYWNTDIPFAISKGRNKEIQGNIPMEIRVGEEAYIEVSEGSIYTTNNSELQDEEVTQLYIEEKAVVFWNISADSNTVATCTITTEGKEYRYALEANESGWTLRLQQKN